MPLAAASVLNSASQVSKLPPQAAALAGDKCAITRAMAANELKNVREFIMCPPRKRFADEKVARHVKCRGQPRPKQGSMSQLSAPATPRKRCRRGRPDRRRRGCRRDW